MVLDRCSSHTMQDHAAEYLDRCRLFAAEDSKYAKSRQENTETHRKLVARLNAAAENLTKLLNGRPKLEVRIEPVPLSAADRTNAQAVLLECTTRAEHVVAAAERGLLRVLWLLDQPTPDAILTLQTWPKVSSAMVANNSLGIVEWRQRAEETVAALWDALNREQTLSGLPERVQARTSEIRAVHSGVKYAVNEIENDRHRLNQLANSKPDDSLLDSLFYDPDLHISYFLITLAIGAVSFLVTCAANLGKQGSALKAGWSGALTAVFWVLGIWFIVVLIKILTDHAGRQSAAEAQKRHDIAGETLRLCTKYMDLVQRISK